MHSSCGCCDASTFGAAAWAAAPVPVPLVGQPLLTAEQLELEVHAATAPHSHQRPPHFSSRTLAVDEALQLQLSSGTCATLQQEDAGDGRFRSQSELPMPSGLPATSSLQLALDCLAEVRKFSKKTLSHARDLQHSAAS